MKFVPFHQIVCLALVSTDIAVTEGMGLCRFAEMLHRDLNDSSSTGEMLHRDLNDSSSTGEMLHHDLNDSSSTSESFPSEEIIQCNASEEIFDCYCDPSGVASVSVSDNNLYPCYCYTSYGVKCLWLPQDCQELHGSGIVESGVYTIQTTGSHQLRFNVYCNGKETWFQRQSNGSVNFNRSWADYQNGFGDLLGSFWLGNEKLCHMTQQRIYRFFVKYSTVGGTYFKYYNNLEISCADDNYSLVSIGGTKGGNGTNGMRYYVDKQFNTCDRRNDCECGWWCCPGCSDITNLNGEYNGGRKWSGSHVLSSGMYLY